jgi:hypothetical protein
MVNVCFACSEPGQGTTDEFKNKDYRRELDDKERQARKEKVLN